MKVYMDRFTKDELISDSFPQQSPFGVDTLSEVAFEVQSKKVSKGGEDYGIADNDEEGAGDGDNVETVIDIVDKFALQSVAYQKKEFMTYIKKYIKNVAAELDDARQKKFQTIIPDLIKRVVNDFDNFELYFGQNSMDGLAEGKACPVFAYYKDEEVSPRFVFMLDALKEERF